MIIQKFMEVQVISGCSRI